MRIPTEILNRILPELLTPGMAHGPTPGPGITPRLTLRPGQVLTGRPLQLIEGGAILDIGGTRVRASIKAPMRLAVNAELWLQVEAEPHQGLPALRVLGEVEHMVPGGSETRRGHGDLIESLLRAHHIPVTPASRAPAGEILRLGLPFSADALRQLIRISASLNGKGLFSNEVTMRAALLAQDRGLPLTEQSIGSLARVLSGPALVDLVDDLARAARRALAENAWTTGAGPGSGTGSGSGTPFVAPGAGPFSGLDTLLRQLDALTKQLRLSVPASVSDSAESRPGVRRPDAPSPQARAPEGTAVPFGSAAHSPPASGPPLHQVIRHLGLDHEFRLARASANATPMGDGDHAGLKASLIRLSQHPELPVTLRAKAEALLDHITGRQLLMRPEHGEPLTSLMIPLPLGEGGRQQWLTIWGRFRHPDSEHQEGASESLDLQNCRILFDLRLPKLGATIVDVHIVNRAIQVQVMTAHPEVEDLLREQRNEMAQALSQNGFQLSSLQSGPLPKRAAPGNGLPDDETDETSGQFPPIVLLPHSGGVNLQI